MRGTCFWNSRLGIRQKDVRIAGLTSSRSNQTKNVSITELQPQKEGFLTLKITNNSQQSVLAYMLSLGRSNQITFFSFSLAPAESRTEQISISNLEGLPDDTSAREVTLSAVYLADGTTEGNPIHSSRLRNRMLGIREQAERALAALDASSSSTESNSDRLIQKLTDEINKTGEIIDSVYVPSERLAGRALIKEKVAWGLNEINHKKGASIEVVKDQIKALTHDIEQTSSSRHTNGKQ